MTTDRTTGRFTKFTWAAIGIVVFIALWFPASWLADRIEPVGWPTEGRPMAGQEAVDRLDRQMWTNYWVRYGIGLVLWLLVAVPATALRRRYRRQSGSKLPASALTSAGAPPTRVP